MNNDKEVCTCYEGMDQMVNEGGRVDSSIVTGILGNRVESQPEERSEN